jgi:hypothetical protein
MSKHDKPLKAEAEALERPKPKSTASSPPMGKEQVIALAQRYGVQYIPRAEAQAIALNSTRLGQGPDADPEDMPSPWSGRRYGIMIDRFSLNPAVEFAHASLSEETLPSPAPTMFAGGHDLPLVTASGVDPAVLRWVPWRLRHSAAYATTRAQVMLIMEEGDDQEERVQNSAG